MNRTCPSVLSLPHCRALLMVCFRCFVLFVCSLSAAVYSAPSYASGSIDNPLLLSGDLHHDASGRLQIDDVLARGDELDWENMPAKTLNLGFNTDAVWLRVPVPGGLQGDGFLLEVGYALLMQGSNWLSVKENTVLKLGDTLLLEQKIAESGKEAETGYMKLQWKPGEVTKEMATLKIENKSDVPGYGGFYWQYFEDLDKIKPAQKGIMNVSKELYLKTTATDGAKLQRITAANPLKIADLVTVRLVVTVKEDVEYIHLKDLRAAAFEPVDVLSGYKWQDGLGYYQSTRDTATHFFFDTIKRGTYVLEYDVRVNNAGECSNGITTIQSMYAPEFSGHTRGIRVKAVEK